MSFEITKPIVQLQDKLEMWASSAISMLPNIIAGLLCYLVFWLIAKTAKKVFSKTFNRYMKNTVLQHLFTTVVYYSILGFGVFVVLGILHLDKAVTSLLAGVGVVGLALSFAFQDIAANFISGIILAFRRPFHIDDVVEIDGISGTVSRTNLRVTVVKTFQGQEVYIPNKDVLQTPIINFSVVGMRRVDISVGVSYGDNLQNVEQLVLKTVNGLDGVIHPEKTLFTYTGFGSSSIDFDICFWIKFPAQCDYLNMRNTAIKAIKVAFDANEITIPFPIRTLDFGIKGGESLSQMTINSKD